MTGSVTGGNLVAGQTINGTSIPAACTITSLGTGTGQAGTYNLSCTPGAVGSESMTAGVSYATQQVYIAADAAAALAQNVPFKNWWQDMCGWNGSTTTKDCWKQGMRVGWGAQNFGNANAADPHQGPGAYAILAKDLAAAMMQ